jgi:hypothetical protein
LPGSTYSRSTKRTDRRSTRLAIPAASLGGHSRTLAQATVSLSSVRRATLIAFRRALALLVVLGGVLVAIRLTEYREQVVNHGFMTAVGAPVPSEAYSWTTPWWVFPLAIVVGLLGFALSALINRGRPATPTHPLATFRS